MAEAIPSEVLERMGEFHRDTQLTNAWIFLTRRKTTIASAIEAVAGHSGGPDSGADQRLRDGA